MDADAIVIGAGFAGLSAASQIAECGRRVLVLEARPTAGGRATAFTDPATGERVDNGQHVLIGCYGETFRFLRRIGAESHVDLQRNLSVDFIDMNGRPSRLSCPPLPAPWHLLGGVIAWRALTWSDRMAVVRVGLALRRPEHPPHCTPTSGESGTAFKTTSEQQTVRTWLIAHGQTPRLIQFLWEPLAVAALNQSIDVAAAAPFLGVLRRMFNGTPRDAAIALPCKPLDEMYAIPAHRFVEQRGGELRVQAPARVVFDGEPTVTVDATARESAGAMQRGTLSPPMTPHVEVRGRRLRTAAIVCAVPWYALADVLVDPPAPLQRVVENARATDAAPIVTVNLWFDRVVMNQRFVGLPGRTMQWVFDKRALFGEHTSHLSLVSSGAEHVVTRSNQELIDVAMAEVNSALPGARAATLQRAVVVRERRSTFSVAPGQPKRPATETIVPGLFLAGDWIDTGLPATIESACVSGHRAADAVLRFLDSRSQP